MSAAPHLEATPAVHASSTIRLRLSFMMFLEFFIWGGWFVTLGSFLPRTSPPRGVQIGMAYSTQSWGAILAPLVVGLIADRYFNAERVLGVLHLVGAALLFRLAGARDFSGFYGCLLTYMILFMPTLALVNSIAFRQLQGPVARVRQDPRLGHDRLDRSRSCHQPGICVGCARGGPRRPAAQHLPHVRLRPRSYWACTASTLPRTAPAAGRVADLTA